MKHNPSSLRVDQLHPKARDLFRSFIDTAEVQTGRTFCVVQGLRTFAQQDAIYQQGRSLPGPIVTKAKPGQSYHNYGLAVDICPFGPDGRSLDWNYHFATIAPLAQGIGLTWGGSFRSIPDLDHFEKSFGLTWGELLERYNARDFIPGTSYVNI